MSDDTNKEAQPSNASTQPENASAVNPVNAGGAGIDFKKIVIGFVVAAVVGGLIFLCDYMFGCGAARIVFGKGFGNGVMYWLQFFFGFIIFMLTVLGTLAVASLAAAGDSNGGFLARIPAFVNFLFVLGLSGFGCWECWGLLRFGGLIWWEGFCLSLGAIVFFLVGVLAGLGFLGALGLAGFLAFKKRG